MELKQLILNRPAWLSSSSNDEAVILSSKVSICRNIEKYPFPGSASNMEKKMIFDEVVSIVEAKEIIDEESVVINIHEISDIGKTLLFERDLITLDTTRDNGNRGLISSESGPVIGINGENHIEIFNNSSSKTVEELYESIDGIDTKLGKELTYAYDEKRGFLLSAANEAGTGLRVEFLLHLPALVLTETLEQVLNGASQLGLTSEGKFRDGIESWGAIFKFRGGVYAGSNEQEIITNSISVIDEVVKRELEARDLLFAEAKKEMEDKIWRSFAVLKHARLLSIAQLLNMGSAIRLGIERGIINTELSIDKLNGITSSALQGSIALLMSDEDKGKNNYDEARADTVRTLME